METRSDAVSRDVPNKPRKGGVRITHGAKAKVK